MNYVLHAVYTVLFEHKGIVLTSSDWVYPAKSLEYQSYLMHQAQMKRIRRNVKRRAALPHYKISNISRYCY